MSQPLRFGLFHPPFHPTGQNPTLALERDLQVAEHADMLGFDEFWFGEHHSGGFELSGCPELMIAAAAQRTKRIRLGTGVNSLPYHHPLMLADRWVQLDHLTRGRAMFGAGPGALVSDALQMGLDPLELRRMMEESLEAIVALIDGETVTRTTDWFELHDARLNLRPFTQPRPDIRVASIVSPSGPRAAGRFGLGLLSMGATSASGFEALGNSWGIVLDRAREFEQPVDRSRWSVVGPMHIAPTREQARADVAFGLLDWFSYFTTAAGAHAPVHATDDLDNAITQMTGSGMGVIGTPEDAIAQIERLVEQSGGFGTYLIMLHEWADWPATLRSIELVARHVMPHFQGQLVRQQEWFDWFRAHRSEIHERFDGAQAKALQEHVVERSTLSER
jgi:limonene 1,2-monooxygenase